MWRKFYFWSTLSLSRWMPFTPIKKPQSQQLSNNKKRAHTQWRWYTFGDECVKYQRLIRINVNKIFRFRSSTVGIYWANEYKSDTVIDRYDAHRIWRCHTPFNYIAFYCTLTQGFFLSPHLVCVKCWSLGIYSRAFLQISSANLSSNVQSSMFQSCWYLIPIIPINWIDFVCVCVLLYRTCYLSDENRHAFEFHHFNHIKDPNFKKRSVFSLHLWFFASRTLHSLDPMYSQATSIFIG